MAEFNNQQITDITETSCIVRWTTPIARQYRVDYGQTVAYGSRKPTENEKGKGDQKPKTTIAQTITGLEPGKTYYMRPVNKVDGAEIYYFDTPMMVTMSFDPGPHNDPGNAKFASVISIAFDSPTGTKVYSFDDLRIKVSSLP